MSPWARYGERMGGPDELARRRIERRLLERFDAPTGPAKRRPRSASLVALGIAVAVLLAIGWAIAPRLLQEPEPAWVAISTTARAQEVSLPNAGSLWVGSHSRIELAASDTAGAVVHLHEGEVALQVHAGEGLRWRVELDAYAVEAVGTRFRVRRTEGAPDVHVEEGVVRLTGPGQPENGLLIRAVEEVAASEPPPTIDEPRPSVGGERASMLDDAAIAPAAAGPGAADHAAVVGSGEPQPEEPPIGSSEPPTHDPALERPSPPRWVARFREAIAAGDDASAVAALPVGFPTGREPLSPSDYLDAGDALASHRETDRADAAYRAACRRTRAPACGVATFRRALMADRGGETGEAIRLATRYLDEHPEGSLAPEVLSRRMRWRSAAGDGAAARRDARSYLARWPDGPHEDLARRILGEHAGAP
jgi:transmembrane sensor